MARIGVIGGSTCSPRGRELAHELGVLIARGGDTLVCGGRSGVMEAACAGARSAGGLTLGILPGTDTLDANEHVALAIPTGLGLARNALVASTAEALVAIEGAYGTLSEIAFGLALGRTVVSLASWDIRLCGRSTERFLVAASPRAAYRLAREAIAQGRPT